MGKAMSRIAEIDRTLESAQSMLSKKGRDEVASRYGQVLSNRADVQRAAEFQAMLKSRFAKELSTLQAVVT
jgi:hypothetical protein